MKRQARAVSALEEQAGESVPLAGRGTKSEVVSCKNGDGGTTVIGAAAHVGAACFLSEAGRKRVCWQMADTE